MLTVLIISSQQPPQARAAPCPESTDSQTPTQLTVGQQFTLALAANHTTGFRWQLAQSLEERIVHLAGAEYIASAVDRPGAGGKECRTFRAVGPGKTTVVLSYLRPFERSVPPEKNQTFAFVVTEASPQRSAVAATASAAPPFTDPFSYCAAVGTIDTPDNRYTGPRIPKAIARGLKKAFAAPPTAPLTPFLKNSFWRCMDGKVYACNVGANLPCQEKADTSHTLTSGMIEFCRDNPDADNIPAFVTGRATVYAWRCASDTPAIVREVTKPDAQGFSSTIWYEIPPPR